MGRLKAHKQTTDGEEYETEYEYNLSGGMIEQTYPSGRKVKNVLDDDGMLSMIQSKKNENAGYWNYAKNFTYTSSGAVESMQLGNGKWESTIFNSRLQPTQIALGTVQNGTDKLKLDYSYGTTANNGNVLSQTITVERSNQSPLVFNQSYVYDELNRLKSATETSNSATTWKQTYNFDRYGNRQFDVSNTTTLGQNFNPDIANPSADESNNRFTTSQGYVYDLNGNLIEDAAGRTFVYDAENKQKDAKNSSSQSLGTYFFDGEGKRIKKETSTETIIFVYDASSKLVAEYSTAPSNEPKVQYLTEDNLGTPRIVTDKDGEIVSRSDYMPYGEEIIGYGTRTSTDNYETDDVRQGFTGYEKDDETGLDYAQARMYNNSLGRFTGADPLLNSGRPTNPKTWNRYSYVLNNPLLFNDPTGLYECEGTKKQCKKFEKYLRKAENRLSDIAKRYGSDSDEYKNTKRALGSYGARDEKNGIIVAFGKTSTGKLGETAGLINGALEKEIKVTIDIDNIKDKGKLEGIIAHEGSHAADRSVFVDDWGDLIFQIYVLARVH